MMKVLDKKYLSFFINDDFDLTSKKRMYHKHNVIHKYLYNIMCRHILALSAE